MSKETVKEKMEDRDTVVLNVLSKSDYAKGHIKGSDNVPWNESNIDFVQAVTEKYGKKKFFITYCAGLTCTAGPKAAKALQEKNFKATEYAGGMKEWSEAGYPTEGTEEKDITPAVASALK